MVGLSGGAPQTILAFKSQFKQESFIPNVILHFRYIEGTHRYYT